MALQNALLASMAAAESGEDEDDEELEYHLGAAVASDPSSSSGGTLQLGEAPAPPAPAPAQVVPPAHAVPTAQDPNGISGSSSERSGASSTTSDELPSAGAAMEAAAAQEEAFLQVKGPEFDASKAFTPSKPEELCSAVVRPSVPPPRGWQGEHNSPHPESTFGRVPGAVRLLGSLCVETDDERGRRVVYGAHAMLSADPWSKCNPNYNFKDDSRAKRLKR